MGKKTVAKKNAGQTEEQKDPVRITELDQYLFGQGTHYDIYKKLGAPSDEREREERSLFCRVGSKRKGSLSDRKF